MVTDLTILMNNMEDVAEGLNNRFRIKGGKGQEQKRKFHHMKSYWQEFFTQNLNLKHSENENLPPRYLLARFLSILLSELY